MSHTFDDIRKALDIMSDRYLSGFLDAFSCSPECAVFAKAVVDEIEAFGGPVPRLLGEDTGVSLTFELEDCKVYYAICKDEIDVFGFNRSYFGSALDDPNERP